MFVSKIVTSATAAEAMGGFSFPYLGIVAEELAATVKDGTVPSGKEGDSAREAAESIAALELATKSGEPLFWYAAHSMGGRMIRSSQDAPIVVPDWGVDGMWLGYDPSLVTWAEYSSATSGSVLTWLANGEASDGQTVGVLAYFHPGDYRGSYYSAWEKAPSLEMARS